jgi:hypothetical protein
MYFITWMILFIIFYMIKNVKNKWKNVTRVSSTYDLYIFLKSIQKNHDITSLFGSVVMIVF